jgi:hypothetical protein
MTSSIKLVKQELTKNGRKAPVFAFYFSCIFNFGARRRKNQFAATLEKPRLHKDLH